MSNSEQVKARLKHEKIKQWQVAEAIGMDETKLCKLFRHELNEENYTRINTAIDRIIGETMRS